MKKEIKSVTIDLMCGNDKHEVYYLGGKVSLSDDGINFYDETVNKLYFATTSYDSDFVITTEEGSILSYRNKHVVCWVLK